MYLIIVGSGPVGSSLIELTLKDGHNVVLIEGNEDRAAAAAKRFDAKVLHADVAQGNILAEAGAENADALVAVTSDDSANLMAMFLGREAGIKTLVAVVNEAGHVKLFERLGVHVLVDPDVIVARHLYGLVRQPEIQEIVTLPGGAEVFEIPLKADSPLVGKTLAETGSEGLLPGGTLVLSIQRGDETVAARGATSLQAGDLLTVYAQVPMTEAQLRVFTG